jgi:hypothetical protein
MKKLHFGFPEKSVLALKTVYKVLIIFLVLYGENILAQNCFDEIEGNKLYSSSSSIINGTKWIYVKIYMGNPLLFGDYWPEADILHKGIQYRGISMNYDLIKNEIIVFHPEKGKEKFLVLNNDYLSGFSFTDSVSRKTFSYEYVELPGTTGKRLYEKASSGNIKLFIKPVKSIDDKIPGKGMYKLSYEYFIDTGNGFKDFRTKKQLLLLMQDNDKELDRFIRSNNLKINNVNRENVVAAVDYAAKLK